MSLLYKVDFELEVLYLSKCTLLHCTTESNVSSWSLFRVTFFFIDLIPMDFWGWKGTIMLRFQQKISQQSRKVWKCALLFVAEVFLKVPWDPWDVYRHWNSAPHLEWVPQQCCQMVYPALDQRVSSSPGCGAASRLLPTQTEVGAGCSLQDSRVWVELQNSSNLCHQAGHCLRRRSNNAHWLKCMDNLVTNRRANKTNKNNIHKNSWLSR